MRIILARAALENGVLADAGGQNTVFWALRRVEAMRSALQGVARPILGSEGCPQALRAR